MVQWPWVQPSSRSDSSPVECHTSEHIGSRRFKAIGKIGVKRDNTVPFVKIAVSYLGTKFGRIKLPWAALWRAFTIYASRAELYCRVTSYESISMKLIG